MTVKLLEPALVERYVNADGTMTLEGMKLFQRMIDMLKDHETRITTLEP